MLRLNAPSGAGCFLTDLYVGFEVDPDVVLMHLLVLSAFWPTAVGAGCNLFRVLMFFLL